MSVQTPTQAGQAMSRHFIDNLKNFRLVASVALEHLQENHERFAEHASDAELHECEQLMNEILASVKEIEQEFDTIRPLLAKRAHNSRHKPH